MQLQPSNGEERIQILLGLAGIMKIWEAILDGMTNRLPFLDAPQSPDTQPIVYPTEASVSWQISLRSGFHFALFALVPNASVAKPGLHLSHFLSSVTIYFNCLGPFLLLPTPTFSSNGNRNLLEKLLLRRAWGLHNRYQTLSAQKLFQKS